MTISPPAGPSRLIRRLSPWLALAGILGIYNGLIGYQVYREGEQVVAETRANAEHTASLFAEQVGNFLTFAATRVETVDALTARLPPAALDDDGSVDMLRSVMRTRVSPQGLVRAFVLTDADGRAIVAQDGRLDPPLDILDRDYVRSHVERRLDGIFVGDPAVGRVSGKWFFGVSKRREDAGGRFLGVTAAVIEPLFLAEFLDSETLGEAGAVGVVTGGGAIVARHPDHVAMIGQDASNDVGLRGDGDDRLLAWMFPETAATSPRLTVEAAVPGFPVRVLASLDKREMLGPWLAELPYYLLAMVLPTLAAIGAVAAARRKHAALARSEASLQDLVGELRLSQAKLEEQAAALADLARENAAACEKAEAASLSKSLFLANMSHELRTPLNAVIGFADMIEQQMLGPVGHPSYVGYAGDIRTSGHHLLDLINDILDLSKIQADKYTLHLEPVLPAELAQGCIRMVQGRADEADVVLHDEIGDLPPVTADRRAVKQVLLNLLSNAIKFTPPGGTVTLSSALDEDGVTLRVADTGVGIPSQDLGRLGRPFEQAGNQFHDKPAGTGLGLALSRRLVELHGGTLAMESTVGIGTTVSIRLPGRISRAMAAE